MEITLYKLLSLRAGNHELWATIRATNGFLQQMVRILTGTLIEAGLGKREPEQMKAVLEALNRQAAGFTAPAQGLFLEKVEYGEGK